MAEKRIVLVVDDMTENLTIMRSMLQDYFDVRLAKSGKMALSLLENQKVDLVLLDIEMPGISGFELIRRIKSYDTPNKKTPIIFVTSHADLDYIHDAVMAGVKDYILKPVNADALYKKIDTVIGMPEYTIHSLEGNLRSLKAAITSGDSVQAENILAEIISTSGDQNINKRQYAEDVEKLILAFEYEKALAKIEAFLNYLAREKA